MTELPPLPCAYRTCRTPATVIVTAAGNLGSYSAGACPAHGDKIEARAQRRSGVDPLVTPVKNAPPPPQDTATPLF